MIPKELFRKIRRIEITTSRLVTDIFVGQYHSVFKGQGIEFDEVRAYQPGDDIRTIDWNVTARTGQAHVKKFIEERELTVMILVDVSWSCRFASRGALKSQIAAEIAAMLAFSAIRNQDKVGLILFSDKVEKFIPPRKGTRHVLRIIREVLCDEPQGRSTDIVSALEYLNRVVLRKSVVFLISDFFHSGSPEGLKKALAMARRRHDVIAVTLNDPRERELPSLGLIRLRDAETGVTRVVDSSDAATREQYRRYNASRLRKRDRLFQGVGMDHVDVRTDTPFVEAFIRFFAKRRRR